MKITLNIECDSVEEYEHTLCSLAPKPLPTFTPLTTEEKARDSPPPIKERANVSPGESSITKMGANMKRAMLAGVGSGSFTDNYTGKSLKYLQLLWKRGEVKFDGKDFYK